MRSALSAALALLLGACLFGNEDRVDVSISYFLTEADSAGTDPVVFRGGNLVTINHYFATPTPCYSFESSATQSGIVTDLVIRQRSEGVGVGCPDSTSNWRYNAVLVGVEASATRLGITFDRDGTPTRTEYAIP